jgi:hypothetical protein
MYLQNFWCKSSNEIAQSLDLKNNKISNAILNKFFINEWNRNKEKLSDGKLDTYVTVKNNFGFEKYLDKIKNFEQRRTLTRFRISAHKLAIETGRYKGIPRHDRICTRCTDNTVEDERHFLFFLHQVPSGPCNSCRREKHLPT